MIEKVFFDKPSFDGKEVRVDSKLGSTEFHNYWSFDNLQKSSLQADGDFLAAALSPLIDGRETFYNFYVSTRMKQVLEKKG